MNASQRIRVNLVFIGIAVAALVLATALYYTQIKSGESYAAKADRQYARPQAALFDRGSIYFESKDGTRSAAATVDRGFLVYINPSLISDPKGAYDALSQFLKLNKASFVTMTDKSKDTYAELAHRVDPATAQSVTALSLPGVGVVPESWRSYPGGSMASNTLGLVGQGTTTSVIQGKYGLEKYYQYILNRANAGSGVSVFAELFSGLRDTLWSGGSAKEGTIVTTIEPTVQGYVEKVLADTSAEWHPDEIGGIVMDPNTGEVVAIASLPTFNGNDTSTVTNASVFSNPTVEHIYEMGSIMKPLTMATGFDTGAFTASSTYEDTGTITLNGKTIGNYDGKARGRTTMQQLLSQSLNVGAATIGLKVGNATLYDYFSRFGLGEKSGIDLPNEATGQIANLKSGREIEAATASYGQGIAVSPIEMVRALSMLANGGHTVQPHIVKEVDGSDGTKTVTDTAEGAAVLKPQTATDITKLLVVVVDTALKKGAIKMDHYTMAAKTGTAQVPDHVHGGYYTDRYLHSFFGYFPAYNPKFIVFLYQVYPKGAQYASETLTDPYDQLAKFLINYYNVPPDR